MSKPTDIRRNAVKTVSISLDLMEVNGAGNVKGEAGWKGANAPVLSH